MTDDHAFHGRLMRRNTSRSPPQWALNWLALQGPHVWTWDTQNLCWWLKTGRRTLQLLPRETAEQFLRRFAYRSTLK